MSNNLNISLSKRSLDEALAKVQELKKKLKDSETEINTEIAKKCEDKLLEYHDSVVPSFEKSVYNHSAMTRLISTSHSAIVSIFGEQVIYDEFGTGDVGERSPHPQHSKFNMNGYSSGPYVSTHEDMKGHYWDFSHFRLYGVPAGQFFYRTMVDMENGEAKEIASKVISKAIKDVLGGD